MLGAWLAVGVFFGVLAAACAFIITYQEYAKHKLPQRKVIAHSLSTAIVAFVFFVIIAVVAGMTVRLGA